MEKSSLSLCGLLLIRLILFANMRGSSGSSVCSLEDNPCLTVMERSTDLNFLFGVSKEQLDRACEIFRQSMHCLDYSLVTCLPRERDEATAHYRYVRISMHLICNDKPTRQSYLAYSGCLKRAYADTAQCMGQFMTVLITANTQVPKGTEGMLRETHPLLFEHVCAELRNMITCVHEVVTCKEKSDRGIKEVLTLMIRGGVPAALYYQCTNVGTGTTAQTSSAVSTANHLIHLFQITSISTYILLLVMGN